MKSPCDTVTERLATGEPLTEDESAHAARCVECARLARVPRLLAAAAEEPEPYPGFSARMQVGARARITARRRNRIMLTSLAAAAVVATGTFAMTRPDERVAPGAMRALEEQEPRPRPPAPDDREERAATEPEQIALDLVRVADVDRSLDGEAPWNDITHSLIPYRAILAREGAGKGAPR
jgi:hypothetical protein